MNKPTEIKYPLDENGEPYFAATHIKAVQGLEQFDDSEDIESLSDLVNKLNIKVAAQESEITTLKTENQLIKKEIEAIKTLLDELKEPPKEEGDK